MPYVMRERDGEIELFRMNTYMYTDSRGMYMIYELVS